MKQINTRWKLAWAQPVFRRKVFFILALFIPVLALLPEFFQYAEHRQGRQLNDVILNYIPPADVSLAIFILVWAMALLMLVRASQQPDIFITFLFSFFVLTVSRITTITFVPLDPPKGLIPLVDPLTGVFYGRLFITKDLFYSGHVSTQCLLFLCLKKRGDKWLGAVSATAMAMLVLVQHVHYTIDVAAAPLFSFACFTIGRRVAKKGIHL